MRDGSAPSNDKQLLNEWKSFFSTLLNNDTGQTPSNLPQPAEEDLPIFSGPPTRDETAEAIKAIKTAHHQLKARDVSNARYEINLVESKQHS